MSKKKSAETGEAVSVAIKPTITKVTFTCSVCKASKQVAYPEMAPYMELANYECECGQTFSFLPPHKIGALERRYQK